MDEDKLSAEEYLILKQSLDEITPSEQEHVSYSGNGTAGREEDVQPTGFFFQMPKQEPVAWMDEYGDVLSASVVDGSGLRNIPLYTAPPQRKPLTRERLVEMAEAQCGLERTFEDWVELFAREIEAAHGIKE